MTCIEHPLPPPRGMTTAPRVTFPINATKASRRCPSVTSPATPETISAARAGVAACHDKKLDVAEIPAHSPAGESLMSTMTRHRTSTRQLLLSLNREWGLHGKRTPAGLAPR